MLTDSPPIPFERRTRVSASLTLEDRAGWLRDCNWRRFGGILTFGRPEDARVRTA